MIDHFTLKVKDYARSKDFYVAALGPLGYQPVMEFEGMGGFGVAGKPDLWLAQGPEPQAAMHLAFRAPDRAAVDAFYAAAIAAGAADNGKPGLRLDYHPHYYGAFVIDLNGHNLEAVCHDPPGAKQAPAKKAAAKKATPKKAAKEAAKKPLRKAASKKKR